ncbi:MAG: hypothetical protein N3C63_05470 [Rhodocyclaceae bacterium]|nr:hypothetical protein [Rhodocyclaceae bacterium]
MKRLRSPQLPLRLETNAPEPDQRWRAGGRLRYLGEELTLVLDTDRREPGRVGEELHLPLPPGATGRQIRDAAEAWLREEALLLFQNSVLAGRPALRVVLAYGQPREWVRREGDLLRCHWRLIEQPWPIIAAALERAAAEPAAPRCDDLFALV